MPLYRGESRVVARGLINWIVASMYRETERDAIQRDEALSSEREMMRVRALVARIFLSL